jgi:putative transferase (TIGR04331 family)
MIDRRSSRLNLWEESSELEGSTSIYYPRVLNRDSTVDLASENSKIRRRLRDSRNYEQILFRKYCKILNTIHQLEEDERYWQILLGHWFRRSLNIIYRVHEDLVEAVECNSIETIEVLDLKKSLLITRDSHEFIEVSSNQDFLRAIASAIALEKFPDICTIVPTIQTPIRKNISAVGGDKGAIRPIKSWIKRISEFFAQNSSYMIISPYLPFFATLRLHLALFQFPQFWTQQRTQFSGFMDIDLRKNMIRPSDSSFGDEFEVIALRMLIDMTPIVFLEGLSALKKEMMVIPWPLKPKVIFTSNNFDTDECFKLWVAEKTKMGTKYIVGQHGNNYGVSEYMGVTVEESTSDRFVTWGWKVKGMTKYVPGFVLKTAGRHFFRRKWQGSFVFVQYAFTDEIEPYQSNFTLPKYFSDQKVFIEKLEAEIHKKLLIRLYPAVYHSTNKDVEWWNVNFPNIPRENPNNSIWKTYGKAELLIFAYDSTGFLECLSLGIPVIAFWQNGLNHLKPHVVRDYEALVACGIVHLSAEDAAKHVNSISGNIPAWWNSEKVLDTRKEFSKKYARTSRRPIKELATILKNGDS